jgi:hypothetical protein
MEVHSMIGIDEPMIDGAFIDRDLDTSAARREFARSRPLALKSLPQIQG